MFEKQSKNVLILNILKILQRHSDVKHRLTQKDIIRLLNDEYDMDVERKSITRNIDNLIEAGYDIGYEESKKGKSKNTTVVRTNFYYEHDFDESELKFLIDGIIYIIAELESSMHLKDEYKNYVIFRNAHNGKFPLQATISPMRVVCENQFHSVYYDSHRDEMYFKISIVTDDMFFRQLDGEQLSDKLLEYALK